MKLVFATQNKNKVKELKQLLPDTIDLLSLIDIGCTEDIVEDALDLKGNATLKSKYVFDTYNLNCFADDTGLEIEALNNEPGVYSARYAGPDKDSEKNMDLVLAKLEGQSNRKARFKTVISLIIDGKEWFFEGIVNGVITHQKSGKKGFGYDPIFQPDGYKRTFSEMDISEKNKISHRGLAVKKLIHFLNDLPQNER
ncbi:MAG: non-canonical purine NTP diphosphatase [Putridiphycobacter sp.]